MKPQLTLGACLLGAITLSVCVGANAFELGVNTHFGKGMGDAALATNWISRSGVSAIRDEIYWYDVEKTTGRFAADGRAAKALEVYRDFNRRGTKVSLLLGYGNGLYDNGSQPFTQQGRDAFGRYADWVASETSDYVAAYEIWNEWNIGSGTRPKTRTGDPLGYAQLVKAVVPGLRSKSTATIVAGGLGDDLGGWPWAKAAMSAGAFMGADVISVHLYNYSVPPRRAGIEELLERTRGFVEKVSGDKPIWINEVGWPTHEGKFGLSEAEAARELGKFLVGVRSIASVTGVWIYELFDSGSDSSEREHRFGLLRQDGSEKPAGCRLRSLGSLIRQATFVSRFEQGGVVGYVLRTSDGYLVGAWPQRGSQYGSASVQLPVRPSSVSSLGGDCGDGMDDVQVRSAGEGGAVITGQQGAPVIFRLKGVTQPSSMQLRGAD